MALPLPGYTGRRIKPNILSDRFGESRRMSPSRWTTWTRCIGAQLLGAEIVYPLTDEPWGLRRFFVRDPDGAVINVTQHA